MANSMTNQTTLSENLVSSLFLSLDESHFFSAMGKFFMAHMKAHNVHVYKINDNQTAVLMSSNGEALSNGLILEKGIGALDISPEQKEDTFQIQLKEIQFFQEKQVLE